MDRREFIRRAGFIGAGTAATSLMTFSLGKSLTRDLIEGGKSISRTTGIPRLPISTTCMMCPAQCGIIGFLEDNILIKIEGNPRDPNSKGKICALGIAGYQYAYNPERVLYPLKRAGKRGEGKWQRISWEDAYKELSSKLNDLRSQDKTDQLAVLNDADFFEPLSDQFFSKFGSPIIINGDSPYNLNYESAVQDSLGTNTVIPDLAHTKYILNFGSNPYEFDDFYIPLISRLIDGRMDGAKFVTFDPRITNTSGKSSEWFPLTPYSDIFIILAMANVIIQRGLYDTGFISKWLDISISELSNFLRPFTPESAESMSGVKESHIRRIAIEFATTKPAIALPSKSITQQENGVRTLQAILLLNAITGNIDNRGGLCLPRTSDIFKNDNSKKDKSFSGNLFEAINKKDSKINLLITHQCNPVFTDPKTELIENVLKDENLVPFHVVIDSFLTETALFADIVLPAATYLESWGLHSPPSFEMTSLVTLQQPVISPKGESRQFHRILLDLSQRIDDKFKENFKFEKVEKYVKEYAEKIEEISSQEDGFELFRETGIWCDNSSSKYNSYIANGFPTPNRKINFRSLINQQIPLFTDDNNTKNLGVNEFNLIFFQSAIQKDSQTGSLMWLSEIEHDNFIWMNKTTAESLDIKNNDEIKITTQKYSLEGKARLTNGIHPKAVAMNRCMGHWAYGKIARGENFVSTNPNTNIIWWSEDKLQPHSVSIIENQFESSQKEFSLYHEKVKIFKI